MNESAQSIRGGESFRKSKRTQIRARSALVLLWLCAAAVSPVRGANNDEKHNDYRFNLNPLHNLTDQLSIFGNFGYTYQEHDYSQYRFGWPGLIYRTADWLQLWGGLDSYYTDNQDSADTLELRPFAGVKMFVPNKAKISLYNFTRYECRATRNQDSHDWSSYSRIRSRFGVEFPLTTLTRAWQPKTFYAFTDVEPFYRFDKDEWDPVRVRGGLGYIISSRMRMEAIYTAGFTRSSSNSSLEYDNNIFELNIKIALRRGILTRLFNPGD